MMSDYISQYLPKAFHYYGMNKIKAGKGYRDGRPVGRIGGPCDECGTPIIAIQMNTSAKGMECTSEKVCPKCGLIYQGAFSVLDRYEVKYKSKEFQSHEDWLIDAKKAEKGIFDPNTECITDTDDSTNDMDYEDDSDEFKAPKDSRPLLKIVKTDYSDKYNKDFKRALTRLSNTNESKNQSSSDWNQREYIELAKDIAIELGMPKYQLDEVIYQIKNRKDNLFHMPYKIEDIIFALCLKEYTRKMYYKQSNMLIARLSRNGIVTSQSRAIYNVIKGSI